MAIFVPAFLQDMERRRRLCSDRSRVCCREAAPMDYADKRTALVECNVSIYCPLGIDFSISCQLRKGKLNLFAPQQLRDPRDTLLLSMIQVDVPDGSVYSGLVASAPLSGVSFHLVMDKLAAELFSWGPGGRKSHLPTLCTLLEQGMFSMAACTGCSVLRGLCPACGGRRASSSSAVQWHAALFKPEPHAFLEFEESRFLWDSPTPDLLSGLNAVLTASESLSLQDLD